MLFRSEDLARGELIYSWKKISGDGEIAFSENNNTTANKSELTISGKPGTYMIEVSVSDSNNLSKISKVFSVTLTK